MNVLGLPQKSSKRWHHNTCMMARQCSQIALRHGQCQKRQHLSLLIDNESLQIGLPNCKYSKVDMRFPGVCPQESDPLILSALSLHKSICIDVVGVTMSLSHPDVLIHRARL